MHIIINHYHAVGAWRWNLKPNALEEGQHAHPLDALDDGKAESEGEELCGICRVAFEGCCPECKRPGDDCPLSACYASSLQRS